MEVFKMSKTKTKGSKAKDKEVLPAKEVMMNAKQRQAMLQEMIAKGGK